MNFTFLNVETEKSAECSRNRNATIAGAAFLPRYDLPSVRAQVQDQLQAMRRSGFSKIRTVVFFGEHNGSQRNWFDLANGGAAGKALAAYASDAKRSGLGGLVIAFGPQGTIHPGCRKKDWGDCYDRSKASAVSQFVSEAQAGLKSEHGFSVELDLLNEGCGAAELPNHLREAYVAFGATLVSASREDFPSTISCPVNRFASGVTGIDDAFSRAGRKPGYYDVHIYDRGAGVQPATLSKIANAVKHRGSRLSLGEVSFGRHAFTEFLETALTQQGATPANVLFWPLRVGVTDCQVDVGPPYTLRDANGQTAKN